MSNTTSKTLPLQQSKNVQTIVQFHEMPEEYTLIDREDAPDYPRAQEIKGFFAANPSAKTLMILYDQNDANRLRSVYQSPAGFDDEARNYPEKNHDVFYHVSGEKLVRFVMEVTCDLSAYGGATMMIPQGASDQEVRDMAYSRARSVSNWDRDNPFSFQGDWSTVEGLHINRVVDLIWNTHEIAQDIPVEFAPSRFGVDILEMLKSAERGAIIPSEVFMYAAARRAQAAGEDFAPEFMEKLESNAQVASENAVYRHMMSSRPLSHGLMAVDSSGNITQYSAGSVLRESPQCPVEYKVYQDKQNAGRLVLAGYTPDWRKAQGEISDVCMLNTHGDAIKTPLTAEEFRQQFEPLPKLEAEDALVKYFGYQKQAAPKPGSGMDMGVS